MAKSKDQKTKDLKALEEKLNKMKSIVFIDYRGISVPQVSQLRELVRENGGEYLVSKKTMVNLAFQKAGIDGVEAKKLEGNLALVFGFEDEVAPAKVVKEFKDKEEVTEILGGVLENRFIDQEQVIALAKLPSKQELLAKLVGSLNSPISGFVNVLAGNLRGLVGVLNAIKEQKSE